MQISKTRFGRPIADAAMIAYIGFAAFAPAQRPVLVRRMRHAEFRDNVTLNCTKPYAQGRAAVRRRSTPATTHEVSRQRSNVLEEEPKRCALNLRGQSAKQRSNRRAIRVCRIPSHVMAPARPSRRVALPHPPCRALRDPPRRIATAPAQSSGPLRRHLGLEGAIEREARSRGSVSLELLSDRTFHTRGKIAFGSDSPTSRATSDI